MGNSITVAIVAINLALLFYTVGVWSERLAGRLLPWHLAFFWLGLAADATGTRMMEKIAGRFIFNLHGVTGLAAIILMGIHAVWASFVLLRRDEYAIRKFHRFSVFVWGIWLIPFLNGMSQAMSRS